MIMHSKKASRWTGRKTTAEFRRNREIVRNRDCGHCVRCFVLHGIISIGSDVDHYVPDAKGGSDHLDNLWLLCRSCHDEKTRRESQGLSGFKPRVGLDGWQIVEEDWLEVIAQRNNDRLEGLNL